MSFSLLLFFSARVLASALQNSIRSLAVPRARSTQYRVQSTVQWYSFGAGSLYKLDRILILQRYYHQTISMLKVVPC